VTIQIVLALQIVTAQPAQPARVKQFLQAGITPAGSTAAVPYSVGDPTAPARVPRPPGPSLLSLLAIITPAGSTAAIRFSVGDTTATARALPPQAFSS
jgi:hypothetical protein